MCVNLVAVFVIQQKTFMHCTVYTLLDVFCIHIRTHETLSPEIESSNKTTSVCFIKVFLGCNLGAIQAVVCYFSLVFSSSSSFHGFDVCFFLYVNCVRYSCTLSFNDTTKAQRENEMMVFSLYFWNFGPKHK